MLIVNQKPLQKFCLNSKLLFRGQNKLASVYKSDCRRLSEEDEQCVNYLNGPHCPCGDNLICKSDEDFKFNGFGAIKGIHDLKCFPV